MKNGNRWFILAASIIFIGLVLYSSMSSSAVSCEVCVDFNGRQNCAVAEAVDRESAMQTAQMTACGPVAQGMAQSINCQNAVPSSQSCSE